MPTIEIANTDPILDPAFAQHNAERAFAEHFEAVSELRDYGRDLIKRHMTTCVDNLPDLVIVRSTTVSGHWSTSRPTAAPCDRSGRTHSCGSTRSAVHCAS